MKIHKSFTFRQICKCIFVHKMYFVQTTAKIHRSICGLYRIVINPFNHICTQYLIWAYFKICFCALIGNRNHTLLWICINERTQTLSISPTCSNRTGLVKYCSIRACGWKPAILVNNRRELPTRIAQRVEETHTHAQLMARITRVHTRNWFCRSGA